VALSILAVLSPTSAQADTGANAPAVPAVRFTGPLVTPAPALPHGLFNVEPYLIYGGNLGTFDDQGSNDDDGPRDTWQIIVPMHYGASDRLTLGATMRAFHRGGNVNSSGAEVGDTTLLARVLLTDPNDFGAPPAVCCVEPEH
jgi:hypothetical protein